MNNMILIDYIAQSNETNMKLTDYVAYVTETHNFIQLKHMYKYSLAVYVYYIYSIQK